VRSTTFLFTAQCSLVQIFGENLSQTKLHRNRRAGVCDVACAAATGAPERCHASVAAAPPYPVPRPVGEGAARVQAEALASAAHSPSRASSRAPRGTSRHVPATALVFLSPGTPAEAGRAHPEAVGIPHLPVFLSLEDSPLSRVYKNGHRSVPARARRRPGRHGRSRAELPARHLPSTPQAVSTSAHTHHADPSLRPTRLGR
jgi:hypothetical protein